MKNLLNSLKIPAEWIGLRKVTENWQLCSVRNEKPESSLHYLNSGVMVEVYVDGYFGYCATPSLETAAVQGAAERAFKQAQVFSQHKVAHLPLSVRPASVGSFRSPFRLSSQSLDLGEVHHRLLRVSQKLKISEKIVNRESSATFGDVRFEYVSTNGADITQDFTFAFSHLATTAWDQGVVQRRTDGGFLAHSFQSGVEALAEDILCQRGELVAREALELLTADECPEGRMSLLLAADQMMLQIHESVGHPLELDRILGDERNYAGHSFVKLKDFGHLQYGSSKMNVVFDPTFKSELASYGFDDGGALARREHLIREGRLLRGLGGLESQARSGVSGVSCFRSSSWNRAPIDRIANINLEPQSASLDDLISQVERGVYMQTNLSWSIDDFRDKFQFGCEYGRLIKDGQLTQTVRNPNYRGRTLEFWHHLAEVGGPSTLQWYGSPNCGKGEPNQLARVGHASPACLFHDIEIFGGQNRG